MAVIMNEDKQAMIIDLFNEGLWRVQEEPYLVVQRMAKRGEAWEDLPTRIHQEVPFLSFTHERIRYDLRASVVMYLWRVRLPYTSEYTLINIDGDAHNIHPDNLKLVTPAEFRQIRERQFAEKERKRHESRGKILTPEERAQVIEVYNTTRDSMQAIGKQFGVSHMTVSRIVKRANK